MISAAMRITHGTPGTWRAHPFVSCGHYVANASFDGFADGNFVEGETYIYDHVQYSPDDFSTIFTFHKQNGITPIHWWLYDDESRSLCRERFRPA